MRNIMSGAPRRFAAYALALLLAVPALAQTTAPAQDAPPKMLGPRAPKPAYNPFAVASWASLDDPQGSLIRTPEQMARETDSYIEVYGRKKKFDKPLYRRIDGADPQWSEAATPRDLPLSNPTNCANESYQTIAGQPATGADMIGALARGC
jgi:hypothetical protein